MAIEGPGEESASAAEIRDIVGPLDDAVITAILSIGPTRAELVEACAWMTSDDYLHRKLHHALQGRAAEVFDILVSELSEEPER
jgi:hypothetical protein